MAIRNRFAAIASTLVISFALVGGASILAGCPTSGDDGKASADDDDNNDNDNDKKKKKKKKKGDKDKAGDKETKGASAKGSCPSKTTVKEYESTVGSLKDAKLDWSKVKPAKAFAERDGQRLKVFFTSGDYSAKQMSSSMMSPVKAGGAPILVLSFSNGKDKVVAGDYSPAAGYNKPFWVTSEVRIAKGDKGTDVSLGVRKGKATISKLTDDKVCGTFELKGSSSKVAGEFVATLDK